MAGNRWIPDFFEPSQPSQLREYVIGKPTAAVEGLWGGAGHTFNRVLDTTTGTVRTVADGTVGATRDLTGGAGRLLEGGGDALAGAGDGVRNAGSALSWLGVGAVVVGAVVLVFLMRRK